MKYIISQRDIDWSYNRWEQKGPGFIVGLQYTSKKGQIALFDRNTQKFLWFTIIERCKDKYAYIVERGKRVTGYWESLSIYTN